ncbi:MAG: HEAT repeat domain-containing protein [Planctomycetota bacterium]
MAIPEQSGPLGAGLTRTFGEISHWRAPPAVGLLVEALNEGGAVQRRAVGIILDRGDREGIAQILLRYADLPEESRARLVVHRDAVIAVLRTRASRGDKEIRRAGVDLLKRLADARHVHFLADALFDDDEDIRASAGQALLAVGRAFLAREREAAKLPGGPDETVRAERRLLANALHQALSGYSHHGREEVIEALMEMGGTAHTILLDILRNFRNGRHEALRKILLRSGHPESVRLVLRALRDRDGGVRGLARQAVEARTDPEFRRVFARCLSGMTREELLREIPSVTQIPSWDALVSNVRDLSVGEARAVLALLDVLPLARDIRLSHLNRFIGHPAAEVGIEALRAMGHMDADEKFAILAARIADMPADVQKGALSMAVVSSSPERIKLLMALADGGVGEVRNLALRHMAEYSMKRYLAAFDRMDPKVREIAARAIVKMDDSVVGDLAAELRALDATRRMRALQVLEILQREKDVEEDLVELLRDPDRAVRATVVRALRMVGSVEAMKAILVALGDPDRRVKANAIEAFNDLENPKARDILLPFLHFPDNRVRGNAIRALWNFDVAEAKLALQEMLAEEDEGMRLSAVWILGEVEWGESRRVLEWMLKEDPSGRVREKARAVLSMKTAESSRRGEAPAAGMGGPAPGGRPS